MRIITHLQVRLVKTINVFGVDLPGQVHNLNLVTRILKHNYILAI